MSEPTPIKRKLTPVERQREIQMMNQKYPGGWPCWPFLPIKRSMSFGGPQCGVIRDIGPLMQGVKVESVIYSYYIYSDKPFDPSKVIARYDSIEAMVDDGWVVD